MTVWVVSLEWNDPPSEVTGDTGIVGVFATEAAAVSAKEHAQAAFDGEGQIVYQYSFGPDHFCPECGEAPDHTHEDGVDVSFCDECGAELTDNGTCDNDHDAWDIDVHATEHQVQS